MALYNYHHCKDDTIEKIVELLLNAKADVNQGDDHHTPLGRLAQTYELSESDKRIVNLLIEAKANPNTKYNESEQPEGFQIHPYPILTKFIIRSDVNIIKNLLAAKANPNDNFSYRMDDSYSNQEAEIDNLIKSKNNNRSIEEFKNFSLLHYATMHGKTEVVKILLENKADFSHQSNGVTALELAEMLDRKEILNYFY